MTEKIFQKDRYLKKTDAVITSVNGKEITLDRTIFAPDSGGQPSDRGLIAGLPVMMATEKSGEVVHVLENDPGDALSEGMNVEISIDWERRFDHMQNHLGEHILSGIFKSMYDIDNKGFHMGETEGTFDLDIPSLTEEMITAVEDRANEVIAQAIPVEVKMIRDIEEARELPLRKELKVNEDILVVTVPGVDCVACCCPHPADTSQIGIIKLLGTEKYKGMTRVHFLCGRRALLDYRQKHKVITVLNEKYSADEFTLLDKMKKIDDKNEAVRKERNGLKTEIAKGSAQRLAAMDENVVVHRFPNADMERLRTTAKFFTELSDRPLILASESDSCVLLAHSGSADMKCGALVKELGKGGRGGGKNDQAQVMFSDRADMDSFVEAVISTLTGE